MSALFLCADVESVNAEIQFFDKIIQRLDFDIKRFDNFIDADDVELELVDFCAEKFLWNFTVDKNRSAELGCFVFLRGTYLCRINKGDSYALNHDQHQQ